MDLKELFSSLNREIKEYKNKKDDFMFLQVDSCSRKRDCV